LVCLQGLVPGKIFLVPGDRFETHFCGSAAGAGGNRDRCYEAGPRRQVPRQSLISRLNGKAMIKKGAK